MIMIAFLAISLSACASSTTLNTGTATKPFQTPTSQETSQAFRFGVPIESESHALIAAQAGLRTSFNYTEPLTVVTAEQMSYREYSQRIGGGSDRPPDMKIWLIIYFDGQWQSIPPRGNITPFPPFRGCVSVAINASDGLPLEIGGLEQGKVAECDK